MTSEKEMCDAIERVTAEMGQIAGEPITFSMFFWYQGKINVFTNVEKYELLDNLEKYFAMLRAQDGRNKMDATVTFSGQIIDQRDST